MALSAEHYHQQLIALQPPGQALPTHLDSNWQRLLAALSDEFARIDSRAEDLLNEADPRTAFEMLEDWERIVKLPECFVLADTNLASRRSSVAEKYTREGSLSADYLIERAAEIGHDIVLTKTKISVTDDVVAGDEVSADHSNRFYFTVTTQVELTFAALASEAVAGDELGFWEPTRLECLLDHLKAAYGEIIWDYQVQ